MTPLNTGIIGVGLLGSQHAQNAANHPDVFLKAVVDPREKTGRTVASNTQSTWYADFQTMLKKESLDLVIVATPDPLHCDPIVAAARAGVPHIITEKPLSTSLADAQRIFNAIEKSASKRKTVKVKSL